MNTLDKQYTALLQDILDNGVTKQTRNGDTISVFGRQIRHKMSDGFPLLTTKKMHWRSIVTELMWFLQGRTDLRWLLEQGNTIWVGDAFKNYLKWAGNNPLTIEEFIEKIKNNSDFADVYGELGPIYGRQWRSWEVNEVKEILRTENVTWPYEPNPHTYQQRVGTFKFKQIDQIANLINDLKTNPDSRRLMVNAWNVGELDQCVLPPCHYGFQVYTRELGREERVNLYIEKYGDGGMDYEKYKDTIPTRAISLMWNQRSCDVGLGIPFNIASYGLLLEIIARSVDMIPYELIGNLGDCHIYSNHIDGVKEQLNRKPYPLPTLKINSGNENWHLLEVDEIINSFDPDLIFKVENYQSHPSIKLPLSN